MASIVTTVKLFTAHPHPVVRSQAVGVLQRWKDSVVKRTRALLDSCYMEQPALERPSIETAQPAMQGATSFLPLCRLFCCDDWWAPFDYVHACIPIWLSSNLLKFMSLSYPYSLVSLGNRGMSADLTVPADTATKVFQAPLKVAGYLSLGNS